MRRKRETRAWWTKTVASWRRSGLTAATFARREGLSESTLRWWSSELSRATRAEHGSTAITPIEIAIPSEAVGLSGGSIEIATAGMVLRFDVGTDVAYVVALARALGR